MLDGDYFVVNGQKVWTSGAHDADWLLAFVRTDPDAPKHKGISVLIIPTDTPGVVCRPFADMTGQENKDFNEVFFTDARVPAENLVGPLNGGWGVANGSLGHERTMMWLGFADRIDNMIADFRPRTALERDQYATTIMDYQALRAMGSAALARAARGEMDTASVSVLKLFGSEAERQAFENALTAAGADGLTHPSTTGPLRAHESRPLLRQLVRALRPKLRRHHRRRNLRDPAQHHRHPGARPAPALTSDRDADRRPAAGRNRCAAAEPAEAAQRDQRGNAGRTHPDVRRHRDGYLGQRRRPHGGGPRILLGHRRTQLRDRGRSRRPTPRSTGCGSKRLWPHCRRRSGICRSPSSPR